MLKNLFFLLPPKNWIFFFQTKKKGLFIKPNLESSIYIDYVKLLQIGKKKEVN